MVSSPCLLEITSWYILPVFWTSHLGIFSLSSGDHILVSVVFLLEITSWYLLPFFWRTYLSLCLFFGDPVFWTHILESSACLLEITSRYILPVFWRSHLAICCLSSEDHILVSFVSLLEITYILVSLYCVVLPPANLTHSLAAI